MKKEIKVRRKRFFAFLLALVLVCSSVVPARVEAEDYSNVVNSIKVGAILKAENRITGDENSGVDCTIIYRDYSGNQLNTDNLRPGAWHLVQNYSGKELNSNAFAGWEVVAIDSGSGEYIYTIELQATRNDVRYDAGTLYIDAIYLDDTSNEVDLGNYWPMSFTLGEAEVINRRVYSTGAIAGFNTLTYEGNTYANPGVELIVDSQYGVYNVSVNNVNERNQTIYAAPSDNFSLQVSDEDEYYLRYEIYDYTAEGDTFDKVTFAKGAFKYSEVTDEGEYQVKDITVTDPNYTHTVGEFVIDTEDTAIIDIYNNSFIPVTVQGNANLWIEWGKRYNDSGQNLNVSYGNENLSYEETDIFIKDSSGNALYAKSGETITITPGERYSLYGIKLYNYRPNQVSNMEWQEAHIEHRTDGTKVVTIPKTAANLYVYADVMKEIEITKPEIASGAENLEYIDYLDSLEYVLSERKPLEIEGEEWFGEKITVSVIEGDWVADPKYNRVIKPVYRICEWTEAGAEELFESEITLSEEGKVKKTYVLLDLSLAGDDSDGDGTPEQIYNGDRYGEITLLQDVYNMDLESPIIDADTGVTMTDGNSTPVPLKGSWKSIADTEITEINWTNQLPVTITVNADAGVGLPVSGYQIHAIGEENSEFDADNARTFSEAGYYELYLMVQDAYDKAYGRENHSQKHWIAGLGIDTAKPVIYYKDDKNTDADIELSSNQEYEGILYLFAEDDASGVAKITAYEPKSGVWTENNSILVSAEDSDGKYSILPVEEDKIYRIVISDNAGNETVYDNLTVKAIPPVEEEKPGDNGEGTLQPDQGNDGTGTSKPEQGDSGSSEPGLSAPAGILIEQSGSVEVNAGAMNKLGEGTWRVEGDNTYYAGGITFYVPESGVYNFIKE